MMFRFKI